MDLLDGSGLWSFTSGAAAVVPPAPGAEAAYGQGGRPDYEVQLRPDYLAEQRYRRLLREDEEWLLTRR
jgi:hypothetical protein